MICQFHSLRLTLHVAHRGPPRRDHVIGLFPRADGASTTTTPFALPCDDVARVFGDWTWCLSFHTQVTRQLPCLEVPRLAASASKTSSSKA